MMTTRQMFGATANLMMSGVRVTGKRAAGARATGRRADGTTQTSAAMIARDSCGQVIAFFETKNMDQLINSFCRGDDFLWN